MEFTRRAKTTRQALLILGSCNDDNLEFQVEGRAIVRQNGDELWLDTVDSDSGFVMLMMVVRIMTVPGSVFLVESVGE